MIELTDPRLGGPFDSVLDVGGNVGDFAAAARAAWPDAWLTSFEPLPELAEVLELRAAGRWAVEEVAISDRRGQGVIYWCRNQPSASSLQAMGPVRAEHFRLQDELVPVDVRLARLDDYLSESVLGQLLLKIDVEGHEGQVLAGAGAVLRAAETVLIEMQNDPGVFLGAASPSELDHVLRAQGLGFAGIAGVLLAPADFAVLQFDAIYRRR